MLWNADSGPTVIREFCESHVPVSSSLACASRKFLSESAGTSKVPWHPPPLGSRRTTRSVTCLHPPQRARTVHLLRSSCAHDRRGHAGPGKIPSDSDGRDGDVVPFRDWTEGIA